MSEEIVKWTPAQFAGTDLLPVNALVPSENKQEIVGRDNIEQEDLIFPTLRLLQGMSPAVTDGIEGAQPGLFIHSASQIIFKPPVRLLFIAHTKSNALYPKTDNPRHNGLERCLSRDGVKGSTYGFCEECRKCLDWGPHNEPPLGAQSHNFVTMTEHGPAVLRFSRTSYKAARQFLTVWNMSSKNLWAHPVVVRVKKQSKMLPSGQQTTYFSVEPIWQQNEAVPLSIQAAAANLYGRVQAAQESGRFGADDENEDAEA